MSPESPRPSHLRDAFGFTESEKLWNRVTNQRFEEILAHQQTVIHQISRDYNSYGEFLFVNISRPVGERHVEVTFYGLGYHEHRERWYTDTWFWYEANSFPERLEQTIPRDEARRLIAERRAAIVPIATPQPRSSRAKLYEMLADLTDEDGALVELEDLEDAADWLFDEDSP